MPRVSIVIPTYNRVSLLSQTLDSALAQTYRDIEVIVVDNASEDDTPALMAACMERDPRVRYIRKPVNKGMVDSYNMGYRLSAGEYIRFLDSDDLIVPEATALQVETLDKNPDVDLVYSRYFFIDADGRKLLMSETPPYGDEQTFRQMLNYNFVQMNSALMRRSVAGVTPDGPYDQNVPAGASDWRFLLTLLLNGSRILGMDVPLLLYRIHPGNHTRNIAGFENDLKTIHDWLYSDPRLPKQYLAVRNESIEDQYLWFCTGYYEKGDFENGKRILNIVWQLRQDWHNTPDILIHKLAAHATNAWMLSPLEFVDNLHANPPDSIDWLKQPLFVARLRACVKLKMALLAVDQDDVGTARNLLCAALDEDPELIGNSHYFVEIVADHAQHSISNNPREFIECVERILPAAARSKVKHNQLLGTFLTVDSFAQYSKGNHKQVILDVAEVTKYWPRKTLNRGILSIFRKSVYSLARQSLRRAS